MHTPEKAKYPKITVIKVLLIFLKAAQAGNEDLIDYLSHFNTERDIVMRLLGNNLIDGYVHRFPDYANALDDDSRKAVKYT